MALDLTAELVAALRSSSAREALREIFAEDFAQLRQAIDSTRDKPQPLDAILSAIEGHEITPEVARGRERRDPALRALAVGQHGRRRLYLRHQVEQHLRARSR